MSKVKICIDAEIRVFVQWWDPFSTSSRFLHYNHMYFYSINIHEVVELAAPTYGKKMWLPGQVLPENLVTLSSLHY